MQREKATRTTLRFAKVQFTKTITDSYIKLD
nr:MAG TPA_asm: hypothetical protein [Caudoviricetes sp.]